MPRQRANVSRSRACRHGELRRLFAMSDTANAATSTSLSELSEKHSAFQLCVREPGGMANCVGFLLCQIRRMPRQLNTTLLCSYGGIGRRGRFRFCWATPVQVQVLLAAFFFFLFLTGLICFIGTPFFTRKTRSEISIRARSL